MKTHLFPFFEFKSPISNYSIRGWTAIAKG